MPRSKAVEPFTKRLKYWIGQVRRWSAVRECLKHLLAVCLLRQQRKGRRPWSDDNLDLLHWGRRMLPEHFCRRS